MEPPKLEVETSPALTLEAPQAPLSPLSSKNENFNTTRAPRTRKSRKPKRAEFVNLPFKSGDAPKITTPCNSPRASYSCQKVDSLLGEPIQYKLLPPYSSELPESEPLHAQIYHLPQQLSRKNSLALPANPAADTESHRHSLIDTRLPLEVIRQQVESKGDHALQFEYVQYLGELADTMEPDMRFKVHAEARKCLKKISQQKYSDAMVLLAECYNSGMLSVHVDNDKAFQLYLKASKNDDCPVASYRAGVCYHTGTGVKRNISQALKMYKKASDQSFPQADYQLGLVYLHGLMDVECKPFEAIELFEKAAESATKEMPHPLHELGLVYEIGIASKEDPENFIVRADIDKAFTYFSKAADLGYAPSQLKVGECFRDGSLGRPLNPRESIKYFTKAAEQGLPEAELGLAGWYLDGYQGVLPANMYQAYAWANRAAINGLDRAEFAIGYFCEAGIGVEANMQDARIWYQRYFNLL